MPPETQTPDLRRRFREDLRADMQAAVSAGLKTTDEAIATTNARLDEFETRLSTNEEAGRRLAVPGTGDAARGNNPDGTPKFSFGKVLRSLVTGDRDDAKHEWAMSDAAWETRDMSTSPDSKGGFMVPGEVMADQLIPLLRPQLVGLELGATELANLTTTPVEIPRVVTNPTVDAVSENQANTAADMAFSQIRMEPHTAQSYIKASRRFLSMGVSAEPLMRSLMADEIALTVNEWMLKGSGAGGEPVGILNASGLTTGPLWNGLINGADDVLAGFYHAAIETEQAVASANAINGASRLGWAVPPKFIRAARQVKSQATSGAHVQFARQMIEDAAPTQIIGYPFRTTTQLDETTANAGESIFGDWSKLILASWGGVVIEASGVADDAMRKRQVHVVAYWDVDVAITQPSAFVVGTDHDFSVL